jgi:LysM repeat protein
MDRVCPLLGLAVDRRTAMDGVDGAHRCHAESPPTPLEHRVQAQRCLTAAHQRCERYLAFHARAGRRPGLAPIGDGLVSTRLVLTPEPAWRGVAGRARQAPRGPVVAGAVAVLALATAGVAVGAAVLDGRIQLGVTPTGSTSPAATTTPDVTLVATPATPSPQASVSATASAAPSTSAPSATPAPTPVVTVAPTAAPTPPPVARTYTVQEGDTLAGIAERFDTSVETLQSLNDIDDPDEIVIGQVLTLP